MYFPFFGKKISVVLNCTPRSEKGLREAAVEPPRARSIYISLCGTLGKSHTKFHRLMYSETSKLKTKESQKCRKVGLCTQLCTVTGLILRSKLHYFAQSVTVQICNNTSPLETTWLSSLYLTSWTYIFDSYSLEILLDFGKREKETFFPHSHQAFDPEIKASLFVDYTRNTT